MNTIEEKQIEFINMYNGLNDQLMQYEFLLQLAGETPLPKPEDKNQRTRIHNCQTDSWFIMSEENGRFILKVDSDSLLIRGVLSVYAYLLNGCLLEEVGHACLDFMQKTPINRQLSVDRFSVLSQLPLIIKDFCEKFD